MFKGLYFYGCLLRGVNKFSHKSLRLFRPTRLNYVQLPKNDCIILKIQIKTKVLSLQVSSACESSLILSLWICTRPTVSSSLDIIYSDIEALDLKTCMVEHNPCCIDGFQYRSVR